ncbi:MAG TPA: hypothetical protein VHD61_10210 [Lacunisphaera sp.]|nr:hypothetical protein [Lacunisphaera sp.]
MKTTIVCLALMLAAARLAAADAPAVSPDADYAKVVFENDRVRIILYHTSTGKNLCGFGMHSHPPHAYIQIQPAKFRVTTPDGKEEILDAPAGDAGWEPAVTHRVESLSPGTCDTYLVEVKDKDWKPSTGLHL